MQQDDFSYAIAGANRRCRFVRADRPWGHAIDVQILAEDGELLNRVVFACHPEHPAYDELQAKSTTELARLAAAQLGTGRHEDALAQAREASFVLLMRLDLPEGLLSSQTASYSPTSLRI
ncbi:hypothetical protein [Inquilinus limosus]|uniref:Uncharacterized protein n=1 Tax=Inquilinus limosus MP06 TaxID=1398085 RepID=A0A0A0D8S7_9PROT|nr:hypothetical protein [Inquilinus limosus]KGM34243.1 hypothetical protein P409_11350 [Inquilinus limosus MP06]